MLARDGTKRLYKRKVGKDGRKDSVESGGSKGVEGMSEKAVENASSWWKGNV